jgi:transcriptional regulator with XRE-family HTH domain
MAKRGENTDVSRLVVGFLRFFARQTQAGFAEASGIHQPDVSQYESGDRTPSERTLRRMAAAAGLPWFVVAHLRRFYGALLDAARHGDGAPPPVEDRLERAILAPALLALAAYRLEDETAED